MKYIRPFNESKENLVEELQDLCDSYFAYLYDEGFEIRISTGLLEEICIKLCKPNNDGPTYNFSWDEIKDYFIPFLQRLLTKVDLYQASYIIKTGILFNYIKPKHIHHAKANAPWYDYPSEQDTKIFQPTPQQIINDEILDEPSTIYSTAKCMNHIYEISILVK
jgi:hypothetical protein